MQQYVRSLEIPATPKEKTVKLTDVLVGSTFRLAETSEEEAFEKPGQSFYTRPVSNGVEKDGRVRTFTDDMLSERLMDGDRLVVIHKKLVAIKRSEKIESGPTEMVDESDRQ